MNKCQEKFFHIGKQIFVLTVGMISYTYQSSEHKCLWIKVMVKNPNKEI